MEAGRSKLGKLKLADVEVQTSANRLSGETNVGKTSDYYDSLYVMLSLYGVSINCLVDTGSTMTVLKKQYYDSLPEDQRPPLRACHGRLRMADGSEVSVIGEVDISASIDSQIITLKMYVANIEAAAILGMDFFRNHGCMVDMRDGTICINGQYHECVKTTDNRKIAQITLKETTVVPPLSEMILQGTIAEMPNFSEGLVEPSPKFLRCNRVVLAKAVINPQQSLVPLRVLNLSDRPTTLYRNTVLATCEPILAIIKLPEAQRVRGLAVQPEGLAGDRAEPDPPSGLPNHLRELWEAAPDSLTQQQRVVIEQLLAKHATVFAKSNDDMGRTNVATHKINTGDAAPVKQPPRRVALSLRAEAEAEVKRMLDIGIIRHSVSPWAAPVVLIRKKDQSVRYCIDYRRLNSITVKDSYPLPRIDDSLEALQGAHFFSTIDLFCGYWQVAMDPDDAKKTAFCTSNGGLYEFTVMSMGLVSAPATFERLMERVLAGLHWKTCLIYLDDVIVFSNTFEDHVSRLDDVLACIGKAGLKVSPKKCSLFQEKVNFLGHVVSKQGISTDPTKVAAVKDWKTPSNVREVRSFLGLCSYYRKFVGGFADIARPLHHLTEAERPFVWSRECQQAFEMLKSKLTSAPILGYPVSQTPYTLDTDASGVGIGAVLSQIQDGVERVISYFSRVLTKEERRYCVTRRELLAVVEAVKHYHHYVYGTPTKVRTDHGALRWLMGFKNPEGQMARWLEVIGTYNLEIQHRPGRKHGNADALSRRPCESCAYCERNESREQNARNQADCGCTCPNDTPATNVVDECQVRVVGTHGQAGDAAGNPPHEPYTLGQNWIEPWSHDDLREWQHKDRDISQVLGWKQSGRRPDWSEMRAEGISLRRYWSMWSETEIHNEVLYRRCGIDGQPEPKLRLVAPKEIRDVLFKHIHQNRMAGHFGVKKTLFNVKLRFWWADILADVTRWCHECRPCQFRNVRTGRGRAALRQDPVGSPLERIAMDILSLPVESQAGNTCILVVSDYFTKWTEAFALPDHKAITVADTLVTEVFLRYGTPRVIHSDQGREFQSDLMKELYALLDIQQTRTAPYRPQSDGLVERLNRTILAMLSKLSADNPGDWDDHLPYVMCAYRATIHQSTGSSPNRLMLGREITFPIDLMLTPPDQLGEYCCQTEYAEWLRNAMQHNFELARSYLGKAASRQKRYYDKRAKDRMFKVGDWVLRFYPPSQGQNKLAFPYTGPYLVTSHPGEVTYTIQRSSRSKPITVHMDDLKSYCGSDTPPNWLLSEPDEELTSRPRLDDPASDSEVGVVEGEETPAGTCPEVPLASYIERRGKRLRQPPRRFGWEQ